MSVRTTTNRAKDQICELVPFTTHGHLEGRAVGSTTPLYEGYLPREWSERFRKDRARMDYVVYSYATPIAWHLAGTVNDRGGWVKPDLRYSVTTSRHQGQCPGPFIALDDAPTPGVLT